MKQGRLRFLLVLLGVIIMVAAVAILFTISRSDASSVLDTGASLENHTTIPVEACISAEGEAAFHKLKYINNGDYYHLNGLQSDLSYLDSIGLNGEDVLYDALTEGLWDTYRKSFSGFYPDTLIMFVDWAERLDLFTEVAPKHAMLFQPVIYYWMEKVTENLESNYRNDRSLKFNYKFRFVQDRCEQLKFGTVIGNKKIEKLMYNIMDKNWSYLWDRLVGSTTLPERMLLLFLTIVTFYGYVCIVRVHLKK